MLTRNLGGGYHGSVCNIIVLACVCARLDLRSGSKVRVRMSASVPLPLHQALPSHIPTFPRGLSGAARDWHEADDLLLSPAVQDGPQQPRRQHTLREDIWARLPGSSSGASFSCREALIYRSDSTAGGQYSGCFHPGRRSVRTGDADSAVASSAVEEVHSAIRSCGADSAVATAIV